MCQGNGQGALRFMSRHNEFQWAQYDISRTIVIRSLHADSDVTVAGQPQALFGDGRPRDGAA